MQKNNSGFSLLEVVITVAIIGIFFLGVTAVFTTLNKSSMISRTRTVAPNLAQEKIEYLKNVSYSRLRPTPQSDYLTYGHDNTYYPPENGVLVGELHYNRTVLIKRVKENSSGTLDELLPDAGDTGLKKITVTVSWNEGGNPKSISMSNLRDDPDRRSLSGEISGTVTDADTSANLQGVSISIINNLNWNDMSDSGGEYLIRVPTGTYSFRATKSGYWTYSSSQMAVPSPITVDFAMQEKTTGSATGYVFVNYHPVISKIVASTITVLTEDLEWIELYNPTPYSWDMNASSFTLNYVYLTNIPTTINLHFFQTTLPPFSYYLIANTGTLVIGGYTINADAKYSGGDLQDIIPQGFGKFGIQLVQNGVVIEKVGWQQSAAPPNGMETKGISDKLEIGQTHVRKIDDTITDSALGNAYDSDDNYFDFASNLNISDYLPLNSATTRSPVSGTPAFGAIITCDDGVSLSTTAWSVSLGKLAYFELPLIATGTRTVSAFHQSAPNKGFRQVENVSILTSGQIVGVANASTNPAWPMSGRNYIILSSAPTLGYVTGKVTDGGSPLSGIQVEKGTYFTSTDANGEYLLALTEGFHDISANLDNLNASYTSQTLENVPVFPGSMTNNTDFTISLGGAIGGRVLTDGGDFLDGVLIIALDSTNSEVSSALTQPDGTYTISNLPASGNTYTIIPRLDSSETCSPEAGRTVDVPITGSIQWQDTSNQFSSFTVTGAFGKITGIMTNNGEPIPTGVLVIASTNTISSPPPDFDYNLRATGPVYYGTISDSDGTYSLPVQGNQNYNISAWFTTMSDGIPNTSVKPVTNKLVTSTGTTTVNLSWP